MRYILDHDYHIHSYLSPCSNDEKQNKYTILESAEKMGLRDIVLTDHYWDEDVPCGGEIWQCNNAKIAESLPLPQSEKVSFHFGCEAEMDKYGLIGLDRKKFDRFEFIIVPLNHLHTPWSMIQPRETWDKKVQAHIYVERIYNALNQNLPWKKVGIAHLTWEGLTLAKPDYKWPDHIETLNYITDAEWKMLFEYAAERQCGIELNDLFYHYHEGEEQDALLRPYKIAKECGCKFYFGSDAHHPGDMEKLTARAEFFIDRLGLTEDDKFKPFN